MSEETQKMVETEKKESAFVLLKKKDFSAIFIGGFISNMGTWFTQVAVLFYALSLVSHLPVDEATQAVALITTFTLLPMLLLGPIGGVIADKYNRKWIMFSADLLGIAVATGLIFANQMWHLYLLLTLSSSVRQFFYPARTAALPMIVKQEQLLSANGFIQTTNQLCRMLGPLAAGFIIAAAGYQIAFIIDAASYAVSAIFILIIATDLTPPKNGEKVNVKSVFVGMRDGAKITFTDKIISLVVISFGVTIFAIGAIDPVAVPYLNYVFGLGEEDFGMMMMFSALSGVIAAVGLSIKGKLNNKLTFMSVAIIALGASVVFLSIAPFMPGPVVWLYVGMAAIGFTNVGFAIPFSTLLQSIVNNEHLGKVSGIIDTIMTGASLLASVLAVTLAKHIQISTLLGIVAGVILASGITFIVITRVKKMDQSAQDREKEMKLFKEQQKKAEELPTLTFDRAEVDELPTLNP
jgi:MFS family permease